MGSPSNCSYHGRAAWKSRTRRPAKRCNDIAASLDHAAAGDAVTFALTRRRARPSVPDYAAGRSSTSRCSSGRGSSRAVAARSCAPRGCRGAALKDAAGGSRITASSGTRASTPSPSTCAPLRTRSDDPARMIPPDSIDPASPCEIAIHVRLRCPARAGGRRGPSPRNWRAGGTSAAEDAPGVRHDGRPPGGRFPLMSVEHLAAASITLPRPEPSMTTTTPISTGVDFICISMKVPGAESRRAADAAGHGLRGDPTKLCRTRSR